MALRRQGVVQRENSPTTENTIIQNEEVAKTERIKTNSKRRKDLRMATWNV
jgi:hypothetical protein